MNNVILSTRNIDDFITDVANEVVKKFDSWNIEAPPQESKNENPYNIKEIALLIGFTVPTLYGYCQRNEIPHHKKGNRLFFFKTEIIEWIKSGKRKTDIEIQSDINNYLSNKKTEKCSN